MIISKFNTRDASNVPHKMSLNDPFTKEVLRDEDGRTLDFFVYGIQSDASRNARKARVRKYGKGDLSGAVAEQAGAEFIAEITQGWSDNIEDEQGKIKYTGIESAAELFKKHDWIATQVYEFAMNLENFDPKR